MNDKEDILLLQCCIQYQQQIRLHLTFKTRSIEKPASGIRVYNIMHHLYEKVTLVIGHLIN